mmetsp:Transcript_6819/g.12627  ORF Transcript_6819/g.12627 Transcript_6819/m.12627 type:complete len:120 (-) Transcript_6819:122-481(-)
MLQEKYRKQGFSVLAFPIMDFKQELGSNEEIENFVKEHYPQVDFPMFGLSTLHESPVYQTLFKQVPEKRVEWNFFKYLVDGNGQVVNVYDHKTPPLTLSDDIERLLAAPRHGGHKLVTE